MAGLRVQVAEVTAIYRDEDQTPCQVDYATWGPCCMGAACDGVACNPLAPLSVCANGGAFAERKVTCVRARVGNATKVTPAGATR